MKKGITFIIYLLVTVCVIFVLYLLYNFFKFESNESYPEVAINEVLSLYELFPSVNYNPGSSFYIDDYLNRNNLSYPLMSLVTYNYINRIDPSKIESIREVIDDKNVVKKIDKKYFLDKVKYIFGNTNYYVSSFNVDSATSAFTKDEYDYIYLYESTNYLDDVIYFKGFESYTIENSRDLVIIEYFLKCDKLNKLCYDGDVATSINSIKYTDNMNIDSIKDRLKRYEHRFIYEDGHYTYLSSK